MALLEAVAQNGWIWLDPLITHVTAKEMAVIIPPHDAGKVDGYIDNLIDTYSDLPENFAWITEIERDRER